MNKKTNIRLLSFIIFVIIFSFSGQFVLAENSNLVKNAGFENSEKLSLWNLNGNAIFDTEVKHSGNSSIKIYNDVLGYSFVSQEIQTSKTRGDHKVSFWYKTSSSKSFFIIEDVKTLQQMDIPLENTNNYWRYLSLPINFGNDYPLIRINFSIGKKDENATGLLWVDNVNIYVDGVISVQV